jgi:hypothetical protein
MVFKPLVTDITGSFTGGVRLWATGAGYADITAILDSFLIQSDTLASNILDTDVLADNYDRTPVLVASDIVTFLAGDTSVILGSGLSTNYGEPDQGGTGEGGGSGPVAAEDVSYSTAADDAITNVKEALDKLLYVAPNILSFTGGSQNEIGSTVSGVHLAWSINKAITSQSLNNSIGSLAAAVRSYDYEADITTNTTFTLTISDGQNSDNASTSVTFLRKRYWGASAAESLDNAAVLALSQELTSSKNKSVTYDCTGGKYPYFCYPKSLGALSAVTVGGLAFSDFTQETLSLTNASGHTEDYYVTRFNGIQTGANIAVVWA